MDIYNLVSFGGIFAFMALAWARSVQRRNVNWRVIGWGVTLQLVVGLFIFVVPAGMAIFVGSLCALAPQRTKDIGPIAVRALVAATLACLMTGGVAGTFFTNESILLGGF